MCVPILIGRGVTLTIPSARLNELRVYGLKSIGMTSNGLALHRKLPQFIENGLSHLNLRSVPKHLSISRYDLPTEYIANSLDTLDPFKFELMTRRPGHELVLRTLDAALASSTLESVKLNVVVVKGLNDHEILDFVELTKDKPISVRFIEFMPFTGNSCSSIPFFIILFAHMVFQATNGIKQRCFCHRSS